MRFILFLACSFALISCDKSIVFQDYQDLSDNLEWRKSDKREFVIDINDNLQPYEHIFMFRHATGYPYRDLDIRITEVGPDGQVVTRDEIIPVRGEKGEMFGKADGDLVDVSYTLEKEKHFEKWGKYTYTIEHTMPWDTIHLALEVGMILKKKIQE